MKKLLFITWDGPQTSYMEGLFMPIFQEINRVYLIEFHVLQFTWGEGQRIRLIKQAAKEMNICYTAIRVLKKPIGSLGSVYSLFTGSKKICRYIKKHQIDIVMPRSTFPAFMVNQIKKRKFKIIFDADGLPIEERLDFSDLSKSSLQYKWLKKQETCMLLNADKIITRSQKSIEVHLRNIGEVFRVKFSVVYNGRNKDFFKPDITTRRLKRKEMGLEEWEKVFVYCGSLGPQYGWDEMMAIFSQYNENHLAKWLILTGNPMFAQERIPTALENKIIIKKLPFHEVPDNLNAADVAFAIRQPTFSMQGVAPIKLGEYLLMGLPTIASKDIGDTEALLKDFKGCFIYDHFKEEEHTDKVASWLDTFNEMKRSRIREKALVLFSLEAAAQSYLDVLNSLSE